MITDFGKQSLNIEDFGQIGEIEGAGTQNEGRLDAVEAMTVGGRPAIRAHMRLTRYNAESITLFIEGESSNAMVTAGIPDKAKGAVDEAQMIAAMTSVRENTQTTDQLLASLPFVLPEIDGLHIAQIMMGSLVILTDGSSVDFDAEPANTHAMILPTEDTEGRPLDPERDAESAKQRILQQYPDAIFTSVSREETSAGPVLALRYSRTIKESGASVAGVIWLRQIGGFIVVMVGQHDPAKPDEEARLARIRDGVTRR